MESWELSCAQWRDVLDELDEAPKFPPYLLSTVRRFEEANGIQLPIALASYFVTVSRVYPPYAKSTLHGTMLLADATIASVTAAHPELEFGDYDSLANGDEGHETFRTGSSGGIRAPVNHSILDIARLPFVGRPPCVEDVLEMWLQATVPEESRAVSMLPHLSHQFDLGRLAHGYYTIQSAFAEARRRHEASGYCCAGDVDESADACLAECDGDPGLIDVSPYADAGTGNPEDGLYPRCGVFLVDDYSYNYECVIMSGPLRGAVLSNNVIIIDSSSLGGVFTDLHAYHRMRPLYYAGSRSLAHLQNCENREQSI